MSVPATAAMHANTVMAAALRRYRSAVGGQRVYEAIRLVLMLLLLLALVMLSPLILVVFTVLFLLGLVASVLPINALRTAVMKAQLISIGTIGDTKRLIDSPTHAGAIKSPVVDGIAWLRRGRHAASAVGATTGRLERPSMRLTHGTDAVRANVVGDRRLHARQYGRPRVTRPGPRLRAKPQVWM